MLLRTHFYFLFQVDFARATNALSKNEELEFERNKERFSFLKWGAKVWQNHIKDFGTI